MAEVDVVGLLVAVERLVAAHREELDALNVFPVPDGDTGRNVLATVRAARVGAEQAAPGDRRAAAIDSALQGARGNAGSLVSQLLHALLEDAAGRDDAWPARLARADALTRAAVARPVEGSLLTAVRAAATAAAEHDEPSVQLRAAVAAAHLAVEESPGLLEVLARAGVVDAGARAAALVLEAVAACEDGVAPDPPPVEVPADGPPVEQCQPSDARYEVMYLLDPAGPDAAGPLREALARVGESVVVVGADRLVSVHVHTDDIGAAIDAGLAHGRPHRVRVQDLLTDAAEAAARVGAVEPPAAVTSSGTGLVVGADGVGVARLAARAGAITLPLLPGRPPTPQEVRAAVERTGRERVVVLPGVRDLAAMAVPGPDGVQVEVVTAVDDAARVLAVLAVLGPGELDPALLAEVAGAVRTAHVRQVEDGWAVDVDPGRGTSAATSLAALAAAASALGEDHGAPELATLLLGRDVDAALREAAADTLQLQWPDAEVEVVDAELRGATFLVGVE